MSGQKHDDAFPGEEITPSPEAGYEGEHHGLIDWVHEHLPHHEEADETSTEAGNDDPR